MPQALYVRKNAIRFAIAKGPKSGTSGNGKGRVKLLALGDSIIAGVGADNLSKALVGQIAYFLAKKLNRPVDWLACGKNGADTYKITHSLAPQLVDEEANYIVLSTGVNDITGLSRLNSWKNNLNSLLLTLVKSHPGAIIAVTGIPPLGEFPLLPQPLRALFGLRGESFCQVAQDLIDQHPSVIYIPLKFETDPLMFSEDGFHPSEKGYEKIGEHMAQIMIESANNKSIKTLALKGNK